jgi:hypothetical protein
MYITKCAHLAPAPTLISDFSLPPSLPPFLPPSSPSSRFPWRILCGQGCNQAIACAKLLSSSSGDGIGGGSAVSFLGQFGNDAASSDLRRALTSSGVRISPRSGTSEIHPTGRGYVMIVPDTGEVCAVVSGGSNLYGWGRWGGGGGATEEEEEEETEEKTTTMRRRRR